jgi:hypothetical protein
MVGLDRSSTIELKHRSAWTIVYNELIHPEPLGLIDV